MAGCAIVTFFQGILEIVLRIAATALAIGVLISAAVAVGTINNNDTLEDILDIDDPTDELEEFQDDITGSRGTCSWLIFLSLVVFGVEGLWILLRFLNIGLVNLKIKIFLAIDIIVGIFLALGFFAGGICAAYYAAQWTDYVDDVQDAIDLLKAHDIPVPDLLEDNLADYEMIRDGLAAASALSFFTTGVMGMLGFWMILFLARGWNQKLAPDY